MAPRGAVRQARGSGGEYLRKGAGLHRGTRPVAGKITVSPVTSLKFLLRPRAPADVGCTTAERSGATEPQQNGQPQSADATKKGGAKTKGRGRKAAQPEPQQPSEPAYDFDDDIPF